jgi:cytochrome c-type biogenesis protein CcmH/NrfG
VLANLATIEMEQGKLADAEKHITAAVAQSPNDAYNLSILGYLKFRQEKYDDALDALSRAAKLDPRNPEIQNYLGVTLSHKGLRAQAETALRKAIQLDPNYGPAHNNLAVIYINQTPPLVELARWHYQKALDAGQPRNPDLEKMLAERARRPARSEKRMDWMDRVVDKCDWAPYRISIH